VAESAGPAHYPRAVAIEAYGRGGFRFAGMSHRGSILCLPDGIWAWSVAKPDDITEAALAPVFLRAEMIRFFLIGTGQSTWMLPQSLLVRFQTLKITVEMMRTGVAVSTYNILVGEGRSAAAGLIAVD
jgi:uncharacterized protein